MSQLNDLQVLLERANVLASKEHLSKSEERQDNLALAEISLVKNGKSLRSIDQERLNDAAKRNGFAPVKLKKNGRKAKVAAEFRNAILEQRDESTGLQHSDTPHLTGNVGAFVPTEFFKDVFRTMRWIDPLFDDSVCTFIQTDNGRPYMVPLLGDVENYASVVTETQDLSPFAPSHNLFKPSAVALGAWSYRTPLWRVSYEAWQDVGLAGGCVELFKKFSWNRLALGIGRDLVKGDGVAKPLGIIQQIANVGTVPIVAQGSAETTGGSETGATTIGSTDLWRAYYAVNQAWRVQPKAGWLLNDNTLSYLSRILDKDGRPVVLYDDDGLPKICGKPAHVCPSMPDMGASNVPVIFGDLSMWVTRLCLDEMSRVQIFREAAGLVEQGELGLRAFVRADGVYAYNDGNSPAPLVPLQNHS